MISNCYRLLIAIKLLRFRLLVPNHGFKRKTFRHSKKLTFAHFVSIVSIFHWKLDLGNSSVVAVESLLYWHHRYPRRCHFVVHRFVHFRLSFVLVVMRLCVQLTDGKYLEVNVILIQPFPFVDWSNSMQHCPAPTLVLVVWPNDVKHQDDAHVPINHNQNFRHHPKCHCPTMNHSMVNWTQSHQIDSVLRFHFELMSVERNKKKERKIMKMRKTRENIFILWTNDELFVPSAEPAKEKNRFHAQRDWKFRNSIWSNGIPSNRIQIHSFDRFALAKVNDWARAGEKERAREKG